MHKHMKINELHKLSTYNLLIYSTFDSCNSCIIFFVNKMRNTRKIGMLRIVEKTFSLEKVQIKKCLFFLNC